MNLHLRTVANLTDPVLPAVIELYQTAFPVREQMFASFFWTLFAPDSGRSLVVAERAEKMLGFAVWQTNEPAGASEGDGQSGDPLPGSALNEADDRPEGQPLPGYLWYLAVRAEERGQGIGERLYRHILDILDKQGAPALMYEVELPEEAREQGGEDAEQTARRRIAWYRRLNAQCLHGVHYNCGTDWQIPIPMQPMLHPLRGSISPQQAYLWGLAVLADDKPENFRQTGILRLS